MSFTVTLGKPDRRSPLAFGTLRSIAYTEDGALCLAMVLRGRDLLSVINDRELLSFEESSSSGSSLWLSASRTCSSSWESTGSPFSVKL